MQTRCRPIAIRCGMTLLELTVSIAILAVLAGVMISNIENIVVPGEPTATQASLVEIRAGFIRYWQDVKHTQPIRAAVQLSGTDSDALLSVVQPQLLLENPDLDLDGNPDFFPGFEPESQIGWRGPYLLTNPTLYRYTEENNASLGILDDPSFLPDYAEPSDQYGQANDLAIRDLFVAKERRDIGRPIVIQALPVWISGQLIKIDVRVVSAGDNGELEIPITDTNGQLVLNRDLESPHSEDLRGDDLYVAFEVRP